MKTLITTLIIIFIQAQAIAVEIPRTRITPSMIEEQKQKGCGPYYIVYGKTFLELGKESGLTESQNIRAFLLLMFKHLFWEITDVNHRVFLAEHIFFMEDTNPVTNDTPEQPYEKLVLDYEKLLLDYGKALLEYCDASYYYY